MLTGHCVFYAIKKACFDPSICMSATFQVRLALRFLITTPGTNQSVPPSCNVYQGGAGGQTSSFVAIVPLRSGGQPALHVATCLWRWLWERTNAFSVVLGAAGHMARFRGVHVSTVSSGHASLGQPELHYRHVLGMNHMVVQTDPCTTICCVSVHCGASHIQRHPARSS